MFKEEKGFSLMETVVAVAIFGLITTSLYSLFTIGIKVVNENKARVGARVIAEERMEIVRNLPYDNVGTVGGVPSGDIAQSEITVLNNISYTVETDIHYVDDDYDDVAPTDLVNVDYKKVRVQVSWESQLDVNPIVLVTDVVPRDIETLAGGGTLWVEVYDSALSPINGATVQVVNNEVTPVVNISSATNADGVYILPGVDIGTQSYEVLITKAGYSDAQTYSVDPVNNPNPNPAHLSVGVGEVTNKTFFIDLLADLSIQAKLFGTEDPAVAFPFTLKGEKIIGTDGGGADILEYEQAQTTDASGLVTLVDLEPDTYSIEFDEAVTGYDLAGYNVDLPHVLSGAANDSLIIELAPHASNTLLITVEDGSSNRIADASVRLYKADLSYDETQVNDSDGQAFFTPLDFETYTLEVSKAGYTTINMEININAQTEQRVYLN